MRYIDNLSYNPHWYALFCDIISSVGDSSRALVNIAYSLLVEAFNMTDGYDAYAIDGALSSLLDLNCDD